MASGVLTSLLCSFSSILIASCFYLIGCRGLILPFNCPNITAPFPQIKKVAYPNYEKRSLLCGLKCLSSLHLQAFTRVL